MNWRESKFLRDPKGWKHLYRLSKCRESISGLPADSIEYFVDFAESMLELRDQLGDADRGRYNEMVTNSTATYLEVLKPKKGKIPIEAMSRNEFMETESGKRAVAIDAIHQANPFLTDKEVFEKLAKEYTEKDGELVEPNNIARTWRKALKRQDVRSFATARRMFRQLDQIDYLASTLANYSQSKSRFKSLRVNVTFPKSVKECFSQIDSTALLTSRRPMGELSGPECFHYDLENEDDEPTPNTHAYLAHVLAQNLQLDGDSLTLEQWYDLPTNFNIFIGEQVVAYLERRSARKIWP